MPLFKNITRTVWLLSLVSLFTDFASEMLYPVMPVYLKSIGFSIVLIGVLEGVAEAIVGLGKGYFGKLSDDSGRRMPFVRIGYALSAISKPMMAAFVYPAWIFLARTTDRLGKGIRTGARDAILSDESKPETKGAVFGLHRAMDTLGAVAGPAVALVYLAFHPGDYRTLFLLAFVPGVIAVILTFITKDKKNSTTKKSKRPGLLTSVKYWRSSPVAYKKLTIGLLLFTLFNSSDVFLLLKVKESGHGDAMVMSLYIFYNLVYAIFSFPVGLLADKIGLKRTLVAGLFLFAIVYTGMAVSTQWNSYAFCFLLYGIYAASTEGISKAMISNIADKADTATAIGSFSGFQSICTMLASVFAGLIWYRFGAMATFMVSGVVGFIVVGYFLIVGRENVN